MTENNVPLVRRYDQVNHLYEKNVVGAWSDVWSLTSSKNSNDWKTINRSDSHSVNEVGQVRNVIEEVVTDNGKIK